MGLVSHPWRGLMWMDCCGYSPEEVKEKWTFIYRTLIWYNCTVLWCSGGTITIAMWVGTR